MLAEPGCLFDEHEPVTKRGRTRGCIERMEENVYFENIITELCIEGAGRFTDMMRVPKEEIICNKSNNFIILKESLEQRGKLAHCHSLPSVTKNFGAEF